MVLTWSFPTAINRYTALFIKFIVKIKITLLQMLTSALKELMNVHRTVIIQLVHMFVAATMASSLMLTDELVMVSTS